jgi:hypothetical protein
MLHKLAEPAVAPAWLAVHEYAHGDRWIHGIADSPADAEIQQVVAELPTWAGEPRLVICRDSPDLRANHSGIYIRTPAHIAARDIWFQRFWPLLEPHLKNPKRSRVFTYSAATPLRNPFESYRSTVNGPYFFPEGRKVPVCAHCGRDMGFVGCLSTEGFEEFPIPGRAIVLHGCSNCGICDDTIELTWVSPSDSLHIIGDSANREVKAATCWTTTEYPTPAFYAEELSDDPFFKGERSIYMNFSCFADKNGGHIFWIQGDCTPTDSQGQRMHFVGQFTGSDDIEIGDSGLAYVFHSPATGETRALTQGF